MREAYPEYAEQTIKQNSLIDEMQQMHGLLSQAAEIMEMLNRKLEPYLQHPVPVPAPREEKMETSSPARDEVRHIISRMRNHNDDMANLLHRLDV